jgi:hypothetical protein
VVAAYLLHMLRSVEGTAAAVTTETAALEAAKPGAKARAHDLLSRVTRWVVALIQQPVPCCACAHGSCSQGAVRATEQRNCDSLLMRQASAVRTVEHRATPYSTMQHRTLLAFYSACATAARAACTGCTG